jgi:hypothetical protein
VTPTASTDHEGLKKFYQKVRPTVSLPDHIEVEVGQRPPQTAVSEAIEPAEKPPQTAAPKIEPAAVETGQKRSRKAKELTIEEQIQIFNQRADRVDAMEFEYAKSKRLAAIRAKTEATKLRQLEERAEFDRQWDAKLAQLKERMRGDLGGKMAILSRTGPVSRLISSRADRILFRRSCPASIIATISPPSFDFGQLTASEDEGR